MKQKNRKNLFLGLVLLGAFALWTVAVCLVDVRAIGPGGSLVGMGAVNRFVHDLTGVHMTLYVLTDWLSLVSLGFMGGFALLGLAQWVRRRDIRKVDHSILILGVFYLAVLAAYCFFEKAVVNYRPVLMDGILEASYPSSTTVLVLYVMPTANLQLRGRVKNRGWRDGISCMIALFSTCMVLGRLVSGVHWFTDIIGGMLLSGGFVLLYLAAAGHEDKGK